MRQFLALAKIVFLATSCTDSMVLAQRIVPRPYNDVRSYNDQLNKTNAEKKKAIIAAATARANQSKETIGQCEQGLLKLEGERNRAAARQKKSEQDFDDCEAELRLARKQRADLEARLLAEQEEMSPYRMAMDALSGAETECAKQAERVLHRPMKDGRPDKVRDSLPKSEQASLDADSAWVDAQRRFNKANEGLAEEAKRLVLADEPLSELDASIDQLKADQTKRKNERSQARKEHAALKNQTSAVLSTLQLAQKNLANAHRDIAMAGVR